MFEILPYIRGKFSKNGETTTYRDDDRSEERRVGKECTS